jgi:hypothetical protein
MINVQTVSKLCKVLKTVNSVVILSVLFTLWLVLISPRDAHAEVAADFGAAWISLESCAAGLAAPVRRILLSRIVNSHAKSRLKMKFKVSETFSKEQ